MSDDSYMYVFPTKDGRFGVENRSASCDYEDDPDAPEGGSAGVFNSIQEAMDYANRIASGADDDFGYGCEYGVSVSPKLAIRTTYEIIGTDLKGKST